MGWLGQKNKRMSTLVLEHMPFNGIFNRQDDIHSMVYVFDQFCIYCTYMESISFSMISLSRKAIMLFLYGKAWIRHWREIMNNQNKRIIHWKKIINISLLVDHYKWLWVRFLSITFCSIQTLIIEKKVIANVKKW